MQNCVCKKMPKNTSGGPSGDPFWDPKWPQIDVGGAKIANISGKSRFLDGPFFDRFFEHRTKSKNKPKKRPTPGPPFGTTVRAEPGGEVRRGKLSRYGKDFRFDLTRQHPGGVRRIQTLRAFRRPNFGGLDAWRVGGLGGNFVKID